MSEVTKPHLPAERNTLYFGDNINVLKAIADASIDLIYLDPPFNSNRDYNVIFKEQTGQESPAQIKAFGDTWRWSNAAKDWDDFPAICPVPRVIELMNGFVNTLGKNDVSAYLVMMAPRLYELHRVLKLTGSLYLHCDPTASHYLKLVLDAVFGPKNFRNEITWKRNFTKKGSQHEMTRFANNADIILYYVKSPQAPFKTQKIIRAATDVELLYDKVDEKGRRYKSEPIELPAMMARPNLVYEYRGYTPVHGWMMELGKLTELDKAEKLYFTRSGKPRRKNFLTDYSGTQVDNIWTDIQPIGQKKAEALGYPTQKPLALLERIINTSSKPGDVVLDPFCGCGTAIAAAQKLNRRWIGIDITPIATSLIQKRLWDNFRAKDTRLISGNDPGQLIAFVVEGLPTDLPGARMLYNADSLHKDFEKWAVGLVPAIPQEKKGADQGIDGLAYFNDGGKKPSKAIIQVKGGGTGAKDIRDLVGTMTREKAVLGLFICLERPTQNMRDEAISSGFYQPLIGGKKVEKVQILTIQELLGGKNFDLPFSGSNITYNSVAKIIADQAHPLLFGDEEDNEEDNEDEDDED